MNAGSGEQKAEADQKNVGTFEGGQQQVANQFEVARNAASSTASGIQVLNKNQQVSKDTIKVSGGTVQGNANKSATSNGLARGNTYR